MKVESSVDRLWLRLQHSIVNCRVVNAELQAWLMQNCKQGCAFCDRHHRVREHNDGGAHVMKMMLVMLKTAVPASPLRLFWQPVMHIRLHPS